MNPLDILALTCCMPGDEFFQHVHIAGARVSYEGLVMSINGYAWNYSMYMQKLYAAKYPTIRGTNRHV